MKPVFFSDRVAEYQKDHLIMRVGVHPTVHFHLDQCDVVHIPLIVETSFTVVGNSWAAAKEVSTINILLILSVYIS